MKKIFFIILFIFALGIATIYQDLLITTFNNYYFISSCDNPIKYRLGSIDARFNITKEEFLSDIEAASNIWETSINKDLFTYDPKGSLTINLVFDKRQALNNEINDLENQVKEKQNALDPEIEQYKQDTINFKTKVASFNREVSEWNSKGGATPEIYQRLTDEQKKLQEEAERLDRVAASLKQSTDIFNNEVAGLNQTIKTYNQTLAKQPEEGLYVFDGRQGSIYIYFLTNKNELIHTLAHELGHALKIEHAGDENAIMYPYTSKNISLTQADISSLEKVCEEHGAIELLAGRIKTNLQYLINNIK